MYARKQLQALLVIFITTYGTAVAYSQDKLPPEEVVAKHLSSIGSANAVAAAKTRIAIGRAKAISHSNVVSNIGGVGQIASDGDKVLLAMIFNVIDYPYEKVGYDGRKMTVALLPGTGTRSALGDFFTSQDSIFKQGFIGGVLSSAWPLLDISSKKLRLTYSGKERINGREVHKLTCSPPRGAGDLKINLFFDAETFQHVRSEYQFVISALLGARPSTAQTGPNSSSTTANRYKLVEDFSAFKAEGPLMLPHTYNLHLTIEGQSTIMLEWVMNFSQFAFNQEIDTAAFNVAASK